jgi:eukaryotic-like serine/threonine-protein kinase
MPISAGSRLGVYEVLSVIGEGGMGRVYRGRDTKLHREVAIKVLPEDVAGDPERVARFEREARTLASLNHPHIAQIYGTEQSGDTHALVMELVEGEDLSQRITRGPIAWHEAEPIVRQIAEALEAAHEQGIVHRDLKPANIKLTRDGVVKVLDFGLAKAVDNAQEASPVSATITSPAAVTKAGIVLGTAAYMSPEQAKGRPADKRSDVWAFGCVLYEMLTAKRAFPGDDVIDTLAAVVRGEPDLAALPADVPADIRKLIAKCLIKDRKQRVSDIAVARYALESADRHTPAETRNPSRNPWPGALVATTAIIALTAVAFSRRDREAAAPPVIRSTIAAPAALTTGFATFALSRQGTHVAYSSAQGRIYLRRLSEEAGRPLAGTEGGANPFFSFDGQWLGFFAEEKLKMVPIAGGAARVLAAAPSGRGGSWARDGTIVFAPDLTSGLSKVSADGGPAIPLTQVTTDQRSHRWPHVLPDGRTVLFTIQLVGKSYDDATIAAVPIAGGEPRVVIDGGAAPQYAESGHLIYAKAGTLLAMPFDPVAGRPAGAAITVVPDARTNTLNGAAPFGVSESGLFAYLPGESTGSAMTLRSVTRSGQSQVLLDQRLLLGGFQISPDGGRLAVGISDGQSDIWMLDLQTRALSRFTLGAGSKVFPVWSPDGSRLYYTLGPGGVVTRAADGSDAETTITGNSVFATSVAPDGKTLFGRAITAGTSFDVVALDLAQKSLSKVAASAANESTPAISPDGRYVAYQSDESGSMEVFVQGYPTGSKWQVTAQGGNEPRWTKGGREIVYRNGGTLMAVPITLQPFAFGQPETLFNVPNAFAFDVTADGRRFVVVNQGSNRDDVQFVLISGWFEELKAKMRPAR